VHSAAQAEAATAIAGPTQDMYSEDPDKKKARAAVRTAYKRAVAENPDGELRLKYFTAWKKLQAAATDLTRQAKGEDNSRLEYWIAKQLAPNSPLYLLLAERHQLQTRFDARVGARELAQRNARWEADRWANSFKNWSDPVASISALIGTTADDIDRLNADIANSVNADYAIYRFWMEVAPRLIQLHPDKNKPGNLPGLATLKKALGFLDKDDPHLQGLQHATERTYDGVYMVPADDLEKQQTEALKKWNAALGKQAEADTAYTLRPDDAASLKTRLDAFAQGESDKAKQILSDPTPS